MPLAISMGGTSQPTAAGARKALGLEIGVTIQAWDADLDAISAITTTGIAVRTAANTWTTRTLTAPAAGFTITNPAGIAGNPTFVLANDLAGLEGLASTGIPARTAADTWAVRTLQAPSAGFTITNPAGVAGDPTFVLANDLGAIEALNSNAILCRTGTDTWAARTLTAPAAGFTITNPAGTAGNPTFVLANDLAALEGLSSNGLVTRTATDTMTTRTITGTANKITVTNGDGVSGNPTLTIPDAVTLVDATISTSLILPQSTTPTPTAEGSMAWDTDDNAIVVGDASTTKIFRNNNWEFISVSNPSSVATVDFTGLSAYRVLRAIGFCRPATDAVAFWLRTSTDNGSTFDAAGSDYVASYIYQSTATATAIDGAAAAQFAMNLNAVGNVAPEGIAFDLVISEFNQSTQCYFIVTTTMLNGSTATFTGMVGGRRASTTARNAIRFLQSSGNIASGHIELWGTRGAA